MSRKSKAREKLRKRALNKQRARRPGRVNATQVVEQADRLIARARWDEARELLEDFDRRQRNQYSVLRALADVYHELQDFGPYADVCKRMLTQDDSDPAMHLMLAGGYMATMRPVSAYHAFQTYLRRWPDDPMGQGVREEMRRMEPVIDRMLDSSPFPQANRIELAMLHEEMLAAMSKGEFQRVIQFGEQLLARQPDFIPAMNNLTEAYFRAGQTEKSFDLARRVLDQEPDNIHATASLTRLLFLAGRFDEAEAEADRLRMISLDTPEACCKAAETFSFLGDDEGILAAFRRAELIGGFKRETPDTGLLYHLAAVAHARQDDWKTAKRYWQRALKAYPSLSAAKENLADAKRPRAERHAPWAYDLSYWIRRETIDKLVKGLGASAKKSDEAVAQHTQQFVGAHPEVPRLVPAMLDRSDSAGRDMAILLAKTFGGPEMTAALRDFCLSESGPDQMRMNVANYLRNKDELSFGAQRMFLQGEWCDIELLGFEITDEPTGPFHGPEVDEWSCAALEALKADKGKLAERLLLQALEVEPDSPTLLNNLAAAYQSQDRNDLANDLIHGIHERWPDYFFGRVAMANVCVLDGDYEQAEAILAPLRSQKRFHSTEAAAFFSAYIQLYAQQGNMKAAESWMAMWKEAQPDYPQQKSVEALLYRKRVASRLLGWGRGR